MKDILNQLEHYKTLTGIAQDSGLLDVAKLQQKALGSNPFKNIALEGIQERQRHISDILDATKLTSLPKQYNNVLGAVLPKFLPNEQAKISNLLSETKLASITSQNRQIYRNNSLPILDDIKQLGSLSTSSAMDSLNAEISRIGSIVNNPSINSLTKKLEFLNNTSLKHFKASTHILSNISTVSSILKNLENERYQALKVIQDSFSIQLFRELDTESIDFNEAIEVVEEAFTQQIKEAPKSLVSFEGMINLFFAFALYLISQASALESEEALMERLNQLEQSFQDQITLLLPDQEDNHQTFYIVKRTVNLQAESTTKSPVLSVLYPNQKVKLISRKSKWIYVEFFDNLNGIPRLGWVCKKYLKMEKKSALKLGENSTTDTKISKYNK